MSRMRIGGRKKAAPTNNNNAGEEDMGAPKRKYQRIAFLLPLPERANLMGHALVCGQGDMGQLGLGDDDSKYERKRPALVESIEHVVDVRAGGMHNLVLTYEGKVYSFGCNDEGALGRDSSAEGSEFEPNVIDLPGNVLKISAGDSHSACLLEDGRVFAWGSFRDSHGNMGLTLEGNKRLPIDVLPDITCCDIASGADHLVILACNGKVYTVGCAEQGQLGRVSLRTASGEGRRGKTELLRPGQVIIKRGKPIEAIWATTYCTFLRESQTGNIWAFGLNNYKQLAYAKDLTTIINPINTKFENVKQIAGGPHHTIVLKNDGACYAIGRKDYGRLGLGNVSEDITDLQLIRTLSDQKIASVSCGEAQSFAVTDDGKLYAWGMGSNHQLGTGSEDDGLDPVLIVSKQTQDKHIIRAASGGQHSIFLVLDEVQPVKVQTPRDPTAASIKKTAASSGNKVSKKASSAVAAVESKAASEPKSEDETEEEVASKNGDTDVTADGAVDEAEKAVGKRGRKKK